MQAPRQPSPRTSARRGSARTVGLALAAGAALLFAGVLLFAVLRSTPRAANQPKVSGEAPPDIKSVLTAGSAATGLAGGERPFLQVVDKDDPTRIKAEITADRSEPLEGKRYRLERPRAWIVLSRDQVAHVQADSARALLPGEGGDSRPEEALLEGNVLVRLYDAERSGRWPDLAAASPTLTLTTTSLRFDGTLGRLEFPGTLRIDASQARFAGRGVTLLFNERAQRLERLSIERTDWILLTSAPGQSPGPLASSGNAAPSTSSTSVAAAPSTTSPGTSEQPPETMYKIVAEDNVRVAQRGRVISGARADAWLRLIDGRLRPGAIAAAPLPTTHATASRRAEPLSLAARIASLALATTDVTPLQPATGSDAAPLPPIGPTDTLLTWSGPLEAVPLELAPRELSVNDVFVRFVAAPETRVAFADEDAGLGGDAGAVEYGATRRQVAISGPPESPGRTRIASAGTLTAQRFELDMTAGHARVPGAGNLVATPSANSTPDASSSALARDGATISWTEEAAMDFLVLNGRDLQPVAAWASGKVVATDGKQGSLRASRLSATFAESAPEQTTGAAPQAARDPRITLVSAMGSVEAADGAGGSLRGENLDLHLGRPAGADRDVPVLLNVRGAAAAERDGESIQASELSIDLTQDARGNSAVAGIRAKTAVQVIAADGASAGGDELVASTADQRAEIRGNPAQVGKDATQIQGPFIRLEGLARRITVVGGGLFTHQTSPDAPPGSNTGTAAATWTKSMTYDDLAGIAVFRGSAQANWSSDLARDRAQGEEIVLAIEPAPPESATPPTPVASDAARPAGIGLVSSAGNPSRKVLTATVIGGASGGHVAPALVESRRYAPGSPDILERLLYLEGESILANNATGMLDVPSKGKLLVTDRREDAARAPAAQNATPFATTAKGDTLFTWEGSLALNRSAGTLAMQTGVRMSREDAAGGVTELECSRLLAEFQDQSQAPATDALARPFAPTLRSVLASGNAWMRSSGREIAAQSLSYNASTQVIVAQAPPQSTVVLLDPAQSAGPVRAEGLTWDLRSNRIEAKGLQTIVVPR